MVSQPPRSVLKLQSPDRDKTSDGRVEDFGFCQSTRDE